MCRGGEGGSRLGKVGMVSGLGAKGLGDMVTGLQRRRVEG